VAFEDADLGVKLLGGFSVSVRGEPIPDSAWRLRRAKSLLKLLALTPERRLHREQVVESLWPGGDAAGGGLHQVLYVARRALGGGEEAAARLTLRDDVVVLSADGLWVDVEAFEQAAAAARANPSPELYRAALDAYAGELLPEDRYEDWTAARRESVRETNLGLLLELAALHEGAGDTTAAVEALQRAVVEDPLHEAAHRELMRLFTSIGRRQQALWQYQQLRQALTRELAADPDPETRALYREILAGGDEDEEPPAVAAPQAEAPAPAAPLTARLPQQLTSFVGRLRELSELEKVLAHTRLLTLTGPGGCGKTRLALELAAREEAAFDHAVAVVELAPVADPALVVEEAATALGVQVRSDRDPGEVLAERLGDQRLLLVLDNCEHLIEACARFADRLLRACPGLHVVATSRERLRIPGEVAWRVPPLSLPDTGQELAEVGQSEATRLFCQRAAEASPGFELTEENVAAVADICRRLDGMPLALELAAARAAALSPAQISARLGDALALLRGGSRAGLTRQQTLRATLGWSHDLLSEPERTLYRRLGVFAGSFGIEAVEGVCADKELSSSEALDLLLQLVEKSLVQVETAGDRHRYRLLETVRQDARERLAEAGERRPVEAAHHAWYLALAELADRDRDPDAAAEWPASRLEDEYDNMRAALSWGVRHDPQSALRLSGALWWFWMARGLFVEGSRRLEEALAAAPEPTPERARALLSTGAIRVRRRYTISTVDLGEEALEIVRLQGDRHAEARGLERLGVMAMGGYEWGVADAALEEGLALAEEIGDDVVTVAIKHDQGVLAGCRGRNAEARALLEECLALLAGMPDAGEPLFWAMHISPIVVPLFPNGPLRSFFEDTFCLFRTVRCRAGAGYTLVSIGEAWRSDGDHGAARDAMEEALQLFRALRDELGTSLALNALGNLARTAGDPDAGWRSFEEALQLRRAEGDPREIATTLCGMGMLALTTGEEAKGRRLLAEAGAIFDRTDDGPGLQGIPLTLGAFELERGNPERAVEHFQDCIAVGAEQGLERNRGWAEVQLAEAAIAIGDFELARSALGTAIDVFERGGYTLGMRHARSLGERLGAPAAAD
jgi:predicted ATPase/DNA-binding SARP family transcriptional activator